MKELGEILLKISFFEFEAKTAMLQSGWSGYGKGTVKAEKKDEKTIVFYEKGIFYQKDGKQFACKNIYRWTFEGNLINMEHLRFGEANPVHLFYLGEENQNYYVSACPHVCDKDFYSANIIILEKELKLTWLINSQEKEEKISYCYY